MWALVVLSVDVDNHDDDDDDDDDEMPLVEPFELCVGTAFSSLTLRRSPGSIGLTRLTRREPRREHANLISLWIARGFAGGEKKYSRPYIKSLSVTIT